MSIPITKPVFGPEELEAVRQVLESGWVVQGPWVKAFEDKFATFCGVPSAVATTSCTTALHIAVAALGLKPGEEVIVPAFTWISTANVVEFQGAKPVFCDIDLATFNLDPARLEALITPRTVGIIPVHLFGLCADMDAILAIASRHGLWIVEDAACAFGAWFNGKHAGTMGDAGCFSLHPRKSITTGEGGMLTTCREDLDVLSRSLRDHGATRTDLTRHTEKNSFLLADYPRLGYNYRMTDIQGAIGCVQMDRAPQLLRDRAARAERYRAALSDLDWLVQPVIPQGLVHGYQSYVCLFRPEAPTLEKVLELNARRNKLMAALEGQGIATRQGTHAPVLREFYVTKYGLKPESFPNALFAELLSISLPLYPQMTDDEQDLVISEIRRNAP